MAPCRTSALCKCCAPSITERRLEGPQRSSGTIPSFIQDRTVTCPQAHSSATALSLTQAQQSSPLRHVRGVGAEAVPQRHPKRGKCGSFSLAGAPLSRSLVARGTRLLDDVRTRAVSPVPQGGPRLSQRFTSPGAQTCQVLLQNAVPNRCHKDT